MGQNALGQSDCRIFKLIISPEQNDEKAWFLHVDTDSWKLKVGWKILGWGWSKMGVATLSTLTLAVSQGINWFLVCW